MDGPFHMELDETVKPVVHPPRKVPVALRDRLKEELDKLVREKVITPVTEPTNWVSSLVLINKPEKLRICIDHVQYTFWPLSLASLTIWNQNSPRRVPAKNP